MGNGLLKEFNHKGQVEEFSDDFCKKNCMVAKMTTLQGKTIESCTPRSKYPEKGGFSYSDPCQLCTPKPAPKDKKKKDDKKKDETKKDETKKDTESIDTKNKTEPNTNVDVKNETKVNFRFKDDAKTPTEATKNPTEAPKNPTEESKAPTETPAEKSGSEKAPTEKAPTKKEPTKQDAKDAKKKKPESKSVCGQNGV